MAKKYPVINIIVFEKEFSLTIMKWLGIEILLLTVRILELN